MGIGNRNSGRAGTSSGTPGSGSGPPLSNADPLGPASDASPGTGPGASRSDHRHPFPLGVDLQSILDAHLGGSDWRHSISGALAVGTVSNAAGFAALRIRRYPGEHRRGEHGLCARRRRHLLTGRYPAD